MLMSKYFSLDNVRYTMRNFLGFTGIDQHYEAPVNPDLTLKTGQMSLSDCVQAIIQLLQEHGIVPESAKDVVKTLQVRLKIGI